ncbi:efflux RND transporter periplasmic adaptor subunit [Simplicispira metamorpha]|uniref:HlyD family secretion protein n=1 Tax=Simplicispira metamorpha TaxID=80881 RepID=A0A4R2N1Y2_9BURK|nr:HlyD family efflux transporter periplasmic adaptor subunit [Simplicispira metamorpha]TCP13733.1 HlyD family secretion protein [Simplicispira metamorpha]
MQKKTAIYGGATVLVLAALLAWAFAPRPIGVEVATVAQGRFEAGIDEDAKTRLRDRYSVSAPLAGRLERIVLREGDAVQAGEVLARLTPALPALLDERSLREQQARVDAAQARVQAAGARLQRSQAALAQAQIELRRNEPLAQQGFVAPTRLDEQRLAVRVAQADAAAAQQDQQAARFDAAQARAALELVRRPASAASPVRPAAPGAFEVRAPVSGRVLRVAQASEGLVALGALLLELGDTTRLEVVAPLLTTDALQARPGAPVRIERWGGPGVLHGRVRSVEPGAFTKVSALGVEEQRVNVLIDLSSPSAQWAALGDGYRVVVRVLTREADNATLVPLSALFPLPGAAAPAAGMEADAAQRMAVFVVREGRARRVPVALEARGSTHAWVKEGLQAGDPVVVYPPSTLTDGARVALRAP